jgi:hypothetical protein
MTATELAQAGSGAALAAYLGQPAAVSPFDSFAPSTELSFCFTAEIAEHTEVLADWTPLFWVVLAGFADCSRGSRLVKQVTPKK